MRERCPKCGKPSASPPAEVYCVECATEGWQEDVRRIVSKHRYEVEACPECGEQNETGYCWAHKHAVRTTAVEVIPAEQLRGAAEALEAVIDDLNELEGNPPALVSARAKGLDLLDRLRGQS